MYKQRVRALLDIQPGQQILEVGAGTGEDTQEAAKLVGPTEHVIGLDFSQTIRSVRFFHAMTYFITTGYKQK